MTSTTGTTQHPDVSEIADLAEGLLAPSRAADVQNHLDGCALCADVHTSLAEIRGLLGTLPGPPRMPADVAGRIDAALAAEALLDATAPDDSAHVSRETTVPAPTAPTHDTDPAATTGGGAPSTTVRAVSDSPAEPVRADRPTGRPRAATGPGRPTERRRRRKAVLGAVFGTAAVGLGVLLFQSLGPVLSNDDAGASADAREKSSAAKSLAGDRQDFSGDSLQGRVDALLTHVGESRRDGGKQAASEVPQQEDAPGQDRNTTNTPLLQPEPSVPPCVRLGTGRTDPVLAVEKGLYRGDSAYLLLLGQPGDSTRVQAYVIDGACVGSAPSSRGKVLMKDSYSRP